MIDFLRKIWGFVRPCRGRFLLGLLCGVLFGLVNGLLLGAVKVVVQWVFEGETNLHQRFESAPKWIHPLSHQLAAPVPELPAPKPNETLRWLLIIGTILCLLGYQLSTQPTLTLISIVVFPVCIVPIVIYGRKVRKSARAVQEYNADLTNLMQESFTGNRVIQAYHLEDTITAEFRATTKNMPAR
jgi:hypothetical protein